MWGAALGSGTPCSWAAVFATDDVTAFVFLMVKVASLRLAWLLRWNMPAPGLGAPLVVCIEPKARVDQIQQHLSTCGQTFVQVESKVDAESKDLYRRQQPSATSFIQASAMSLLATQKHKQQVWCTRAVVLRCALRGLCHVVGRCQFHKGSELPSLSGQYCNQIWCGHGHFAHILPSRHQTKNPGAVIADATSCSAPL